ncbi:MAG TPA: M23 family metallopeptidase [Solirubrobacteraceae bacterium]|nr:M23 family metallopeptidase [Solirubrobacteraceae bacterium]
MRRSVVLAAALAAAFAAPAQAQTGGSQFVAAPEQAFSVSPASIAPGATLTLQYRIGGRPRRVRVRVDLIPEAGGRPAATLPLGRQRTGRDRTATWRPKLTPGRYTARLRATTLKRRGARTSQSLALEIVAPPVTAASGVFPVQGAYTLGGEDARFGAGRTGHTHQGQDILAASGTPVVTPRTGFVSWRAFQKNGAGHYVVVRGDDGRDYVFMHLLDGSVAVEKGQAVSAGQQLGAVGSTGRSSGPHLHFEIWPSGWYSSKASQPIDPLPDLLAWAA